MDIGVLKFLLLQKLLSARIRPALEETLIVNSRTCYDGQAKGIKAQV